MQKLITQIEQWAEDRNLIHGSSPEKQMLKLMEEFGELCGGIAKNKPDIIKDSIGDCFVVLVILNKQLEANFNIPLIIEDSCSLTKDLDEDPIVSTMMFAAYAGEMINAFGFGNDENIDVSLSSLFVLLLVISSKCYLNLSDCVQYAYDQIKDRKGKMVDGVFVKEEDLLND